jgi:hypothetical protein
MICAMRQTGMLDVCVANVKKRNADNGCEASHPAMAHRHAAIEPISNIDH